MKTIIEALQWRYATKKFDTTKKLNQNDLDTIFEALRLSPSSFGLQPWKFIHVKNPETRVQLQANSRGQPQITEASDLLVIAVKTSLQESDVEEYIQSIVQLRGNDKEKMPDEAKNIEKLMEYKNMMIGTIKSKTPEQLKGRNQKQAYIALGVALTVCASMEIDACPMEGFDSAKYDEILWLDKLWLTTTVAITLGYRSIEDKYADIAKVRYPKEKLIIQK